MLPGTMTDVDATLERFRSLRALIVGDAMLDSYLSGTATRLGREAPVPIVNLDGRIDAPGGAANTAANVHALGARVTFLSAVGVDEAGDRLVAALGAHGVGGEDVLRVRGRETLTKQRVVADGQMLLRFDTGSGAPLDDLSEERLVARLRPRFVEADLVLVSDYEYGVLTPRVVDVLAQLQQSAPRVVVIDGRTPERFRSVAATAAKPNHDEAWRLLERTPPPALEGDRAATLLEVRDELFARTGVEVLAVTMDLDGALVMNRSGDTHRTFATPTSSARTAGAGDTYAAALGLALAAGADLATASEVASAAGAVAVSRDGTSVCDFDDLRSALSGGAKYLEGVEALRAAVHAHRRAGRRVVFTNGCFDLVHRGHVAYLAEAKALGDVLVVGLNSDESTRRLKGPGRPLNCLEDRAQVLAALSSVDHVVPFEEDTPAELIRAIAPDVVVKGGDYTRESLPEAPLVEALGGEVRILGYLDDHSTTGLIDRARRMRASRARGTNGASA